MFLIKVFKPGILNVYHLLFAFGISIKISYADLEKKELILGFTSELRVRLAPLNHLSPPVKYFTDRSKAVNLLWIIYVFSALC